MQAEIITIGDELLIGQVVDTNSAWLGQMLNKCNIKVHRINSISDDAEEIKDMLKTAISRSKLIIMTGGLGPTSDDITKKTLLDFFGMKWRTDTSVLEHLKIIFKNRDARLLEINSMQAEMPDGCVTLHNEWGTAPGMWFEQDACVIISMPGVPYEMKNIFEFKALPEIIKRFHQPKLYHKVIVTFNVPESILADNISDIEQKLPKHIKLAYLPHLNSVRLRLTGIETDQNIVNEINAFADLLIERIGDSVVADSDISLAEIVFIKLSEKNKTLSVAESCTGGYISHQLTMLPGISKVFVGSVISYSNSVKHHQLGVESTLFETVGAVSEQVVEQMVTGVRSKLKTDFAIAVSGIAGPGGGSEEKPVGTVVIGVCSDKETIVKTFRFTGDRQIIIARSSNMAFDMLRRII